MWPFDEEWFKEWLVGILKWAATNPWEFIYYVLLCLSPLFLVSALLAWNLAKQIDAKEKGKKRAARKQKNMSKVKGSKGD
ncbi:hypothetical protein DPMN_105026 [Dreissena polymorpha]|uniref:Small integral membrane protein 15 n=1 Tax=Dreissena polymorpha TaxID=45954 RepID=A0A9D4K1J9_DREPO|nr:hypothetical protein DPMN_105026 [Dreissena polymorpha]